MGEWSKKIGEYGEDVVEKFLSIIGWKNPVKGKEIKCSQEEHTNQVGKSVNTHGIDFFYSYINPLIDSQLNNVVISSKFKTKKYPNSPTEEYRWFMKDLINTIECFDYSDFKDSIICNYKYSKCSDIGILFWLNSDEDSNDDLISIIASTRFDIIRDNTIYIMDNKRVAFILEIMEYIITKQNYNYAFYYPLTGQNINPIRRANTGAFLPIEYLNSSIIPIKLENKDNNKETCLFLGTIDNFDKDTFSRLMGLAKDISTELLGSIIIAFPDYSPLKHDEEIAIAKQAFQDSTFTNTVKIVNFINPINAF